MPGRPLSEFDQDLIATATRLIRSRYQEGRHHIAAAVRTKSGKVYTGLHLDTYVGRASVCAEAVAVGRALSDGDTDIECIVSVRHPRPREQHQEPQVVSPCGICRELLNDFAPAAEVVIRRDGGLSRVPVADLLPEKYRRLP